MIKNRKKGKLVALYTKLYKFSVWLDCRSRSNLILLLLLAGVLSFNALIFPYFINLYNLQDHVLLDVLFGFTPEHANLVLAAYGEYGRKGIIVITGFLDSVYPFVYGSLLALAISRFKIKSNYHINTWQMLNLIPFVAVLFDFIENTGILIMIQYYPNQTIMIAWVTSFAGILKWLIIGGCILILVFFLVRIIYKVTMRRSDRVTK